MCLCVHASTGMEDDVKVWGLCDHLNEVICGKKCCLVFSDVKFEEMAENPATGM